MDHSARLNNLATDDRPTRRIGYLILLATFGVFGGWAAFAPLDSAALAPGVVTVKNYRKTVQHLEGGIVRELRVRDGDQVKAGDVLLVLDSTQARAESEMIRSQLSAALAQQARLVAERDGLPALVPPAGLDVSDPRVREVLDSEARVFQTRRTALQGEVGIQQETIVQLQEQMRGLQASTLSKQELAASYKEEIGDLNALLKDGFVDKQRLREQERSLSRLQAEIAEQQSTSARTKLQIGEAKLRILQITTNFASEVANQLSEAHTKAYDLRERLSALQDRTKRTEILAPESGMVMGMTVHTIGGVVGPGTALLDIVPVSEALAIEVHISPQDIDRVAVGRLADIRLSAFKSSTTPVIEGKLVYVSGDRLVEQQTGQAYYLGRLELTDKGRERLGPLTLVPGMPAEVLLNTGARTLLEYLLKPASNALARSLIED
ncbi:HlyD family type I secretion periplasmic adaptor subunit [Pseudomonas turukhanskensis]|uniref:Membrane fusion protein (MFP) family protein n=2 Tax=Pseudomonas turukhanskensis TaxID=1806536 RepID=A0A9W6KC67_9PSED|nr:HlyD family type I secretion periplasmic adaptor subunit [Pseudomonas turukhanskensis]